MFRKIFTIVVVPQSTDSVRRFPIPISLAVLAIVLLVVLASGWLWMMIDYFRIRTRLVQFQQTQTEFEERKGQLNEFFKGFDTVQLHFDQLKALHYRLRSFTSVEETKEKVVSEKGETAEKIAQAKKDGILSVIASDSNALNSDLNDREEALTNLLTFYKEQTNPLNRLPDRWPVRGFVTTEFGIQPDAISRQLRPHNGITIAAKLFAPIKAPADGIVVFSGNDEYYGNLIVLDHGNGIKTRYGHVARADASVGQLFLRGQVVSQVGSSGRTTGPQLYYEVIVNNVPQNPAKYIADQDFRL